MKFTEKLKLLNMPKAELARVLKMERQSVTRWKERPSHCVNLILDQLIEMKALKEEIAEYRALGKSLRKMLNEPMAEVKEEEPKEEA